MAEIKLLPCPFCGGEAIIDRDEIFCDSCHLQMRYENRIYSMEAMNYEEAREQTFEAWNNRATESEMRTKTIDEFAKKCKEHIFCQTFGLKPRNIDEIAEQLKEKIRNDRTGRKEKNKDDN